MIKLSAHHIACFGEIVWDDFPDERRPGGSPGNFAFHCQQLKNQVTFISRVGKDPDGSELLDFLRDKGLPVDQIQIDDQFPTGKVLVHGPPEDPHYSIIENSAWDHIEIRPSLLSKITKADAFCFATLTQRSTKTANTLTAILNSLNVDVFKVLDINLRPPFFTAETIIRSLGSANLVKMNEEELETVSTLLGKEDLIPWILQSFKVKLICITQGKEGAYLVDGSSKWSQKAYVQANSEGDTVGVGDAFLAALTSAILSKTDYQEGLDFASRYASEVAKHKGAMPDLRTLPR